MSRSKRGLASVLLVAALLSASPAFAAGREPSRTFGEVHGVFAFLWQALSEFLLAFDQTRAGMDPDGSPTPDSGTTSSPPSEGETDGRAGQDPNG
ncbi:MAG TPA: hypothetical protein VF756_15145 [Thermoanaerobaculia bacterium]